MTQLYSRQMKLKTKQYSSYQWSTTLRLQTKGPTSCSVVK